MLEEFKKYVSDYDLTNTDIKLKYDHSIRVMNLSKKYAELLNYSKEDIEIATLIGLLHDIGRFEQLRVYGSYNDIKTIDHADYGIKVLFEDKVIDRFTKDERIKEILKFAIKNHNKISIPKTEDKQILMHANLIRDVDKIDIIYLLGYLKELDTKAIDEPISKKILDGFFKHENIDKRDVENKNDVILIRFAFAFDINNNICLKELKENYKYFYKQIEGQKYFKEVYEEINRYIDERIDKKC